MTLRSKIAVGIAAAFTVAMTAVLLTSVLILEPAYVAIERTAMITDLGRASDALAAEVARLDTLADDWGGWDDTWAFIDAPTRKYLDSNLHPATLASARVGFVVLVDARGTVVVARGSDIGRGTAATVPASVLAFVERSRARLGRLGVGGGVSGFLALPEGPALLAVRPIRTSAKTGPVRGALLVGRMADATLVAPLSAVTREIVSIHRPGDPQLPAELRAGPSDIARPSGPLVIPADGDTVHGWSVLAGIDNRPALVLRVSARRTIVRQGRQAALLLAAAIAVACGVLALAGWGGVRRLLLDRLQELGRDVTAVGAQRDLSRRVRVRGQDELAVVAVTINESLDALERALVSRERSESRFRQLFDSVPCGVYESTPDGRMLAANAALAEMLGYDSVADLLRVDIGRDLYMHPAERGETLGRLAGTGEYRNLELVLRRADGTPIVVLENSREVRDERGALVVFRGTLVDITDRKRAEDSLEAARRELEARVEERTADLSRALAELSAKEQHVRLLVETAGSVILVLSPDGRLEEFNRAAEEVFGAARDEVIGADFFVTFVPAALRAETRSAFDRALAGETVRGLASTVVRADGREVILLWNVTRLPDAGGEARGTIAVGQDYTEHQRLEAQLMHAQKMEAVGQLAGGVAHDFNNLLQAMVSASEVLRASPDDPAVARKVAREIKAHVARGSALTRQLLLFARRDIERVEVLDLGEAVLHASALLQRVIREDIRLDVEAAEGPLPVTADRGQLEQVLVNLAVNASDAMPGGGVLRLRAGAGADGGAWFEVADTGTGIPEEIRDRVFEPFFTTKEHGKGTGLGLPVVLGIVNRHRGTLTLESEMGKGTRVRAAFPRADTAVGRPAASPPDEALRHGAGERVLVVEDEAGAREGLAEILALLGYRVTAVEHGEAALALEETDSFDVLLSDVRLPGASGPEVAKRLVARWPGLELVFMSGYAEDGELRRQLGGADIRFLQKPFDIATLAREIGAALESARKGRSAD